MSFRRKEVRQLLAPQNYLYSVLERSEAGTSAQVVSVLKGILFAREEQAEIVAAISSPQTQIISLTVTPSAYSAAPKQGSCLDVIGLLVAGLASVRTRGTRPPVLICCDNMPRNGLVLREALTKRAKISSVSLADWIEGNVQCPCSVVDRIVPEPTTADCAEASDLLGVYDLAAVATEPFRQWVIEDFEGPRPRWELAGAEFVSDVSPWELSKLNLLNGTHMAIAFLGILAGLQTVGDFVQDKLFAEYVCRLMRDEQIPTIPKRDHDLMAYSGQLLERWRNPKIMHQLQRIARNGSEKLHSRLLSSLARNMAAGRPAPCTLLAIAAWACCNGRFMPFECEIQDKAGPALQELAENSRGDITGFVQGMLYRQDIFGDELPQCPAFAEELGQAMECLLAHGARGAVSIIVSPPERKWS